VSGAFRTRSGCVMLAGLFSLSPALVAQSLRRYHPERQVSGTVRSWGSQQMRRLMQLWENGFRRYQPQVRFEDRLNGTVSAMAGLYAGAADLALMGREIWPTEALAYRQMMGFAPTGVMVATGSFDVPTKADALVIFVHRDNPVPCLTLAQLNGIFGAEPRRGESNVRLWSDLGLHGAWTGHPIDLYGYRVDNAAAIFFRNRVMNGSLLWNSAIHQFMNRFDLGGRRIDSGRQILRALAADRFGIAIANPYYARAQVKALSLSEGTGQPCIAPTRENVRARRYPLTRAVYIFFARRGAVDPRIQEFLRYVLSAQGQQDVGREGAYMPLPALVVAQQLRLVNSSGELPSPQLPAR
jgi:phosphate transport system substrate-binding protein